jgi:hypothetical protein
MEPSTAVQVTAVLEVPVTVAANWFDWPDCSTSEVGDNETPTIGMLGAGVTVTEAEAKSVGLATLMAETVSELRLVMVGAV